MSRYSTAAAALPDAGWCQSCTQEPTPTLKSADTDEISRYNSGRSLFLDRFDLRYTFPRIH